MMTSGQDTDQQVLMAGISFAGLCALVTGGASGIGKMTVEVLRRAGARVASIDIGVHDVSAGVVCVEADVTDTAQVRRAVATVGDRLGGIDIVVNSAGIGSVGTIEDNADDEWHRVFDVNVVGLVRVTREALPYLRRSRHAAIVNIASIASTTGLPNRACYGASKGAVLALTYAMAADLVADGVRVNCVAPGTIGTPWVDRLLAATTDPDTARAELVARQPVGRLGTAEEVANVIAFLASPAATFVTGASWALDGGTSGMRVAPSLNADVALPNSPQRTDQSSSDGRGGHGNG